MEWGTVDRIDVHVREDSGDMLVLTFSRGNGGEMHLSPNVRSVPSEPHTAEDEVPYYWPYDDPENYWKEVEAIREHKRELAEARKLAMRQKAEEARMEREEKIGRARVTACALMSEGKTLSSYELAEATGTDARMASAALRRMVREGTLEPYTEEGRRRYRPASNDTREDVQ